MMMQKSPVLEEEEQISDAEAEQQDQDSGNSTVQEDDENSEEDELVLNDEDLLTQQNNQIQQQHEDNDLQEDEPNHDLQDATTPNIDNEQEEDLEDSEEDDVHSSKLTSPVISTNHHTHEIDEQQQQDNTTTAVAAINSSHSEESIQIDEEDLENVRREETMEESGLVYDEEMDYLLNDDKIMMPQTPLLVNNESFTTPNSAGSVTVAMPFLEDVEESPKPVLLDNIESKVDECNITVTTEDASKEELVNSPVHEQIQPIVNSNIETLSENHPMIDSIQDDEQMNVIVMEDDQVINQEVEKTSLVQQQETNNVNNNDIILSINLDEDLDIDMINDFLQSEKGTDLCEAHSKENSPHGDSISNQSVNDSWNTNYTIESSNATHYRQHSTTTPLLYRKSASITQGIPLEVLLTNYDHRIEFSTLEMLVKELEGIGVHTINYLPLIPKKQIMALPGMDDKLYENLMDSAQSLDPSQSFGFSTATQFLHEFHTKRYKVTTGCTAFDELIGGGFESSSVSELFSESGCGKTQVCFTLCLTAQLPLIEDGPSGKVLFVDTMGTFNPNRIKSIAERFAKDDERMTTLFMNNILKERIYTSEQLFANLSRITTLLKNNKGKPVKMIIVDSAVNLFRSEYKGKDEITVRQQYLLKYLDSLNKLAEQFNIAVVITNQVMDSFDKPSLLYSPYKQNNSPSIKPVGGHILAHTIPTRIQLAREKQKRIARVFKSSTRPEGSCNFSIRATGISDYEEE